MENFNMKTVCQLQMYLLPKASSTNLGVQPEQFPVLYAFSTENEERQLKMLVLMG